MKSPQNGQRGGDCRSFGLLAVAATLAVLAGCQGMASPDCYSPCAGSCNMAIPIEGQTTDCRCSKRLLWGGYAETEPEYVPPRFHPAPTRPVFAPTGYFGESICEDSIESAPMATSSQRGLDIEVLPPAPVPEEILNPTADPGPQDRMTRAPRRLVDRPTDASWLFPVSPRRDWDRLARWPNPGRR